MKRLLLTLTLMSIFGLFGAKAEPLAVGTPAPDLTATNQDGEPVKFADVYAKGLTLVYFYPKADTPGCTAQACSIRDAYAGLTGEGLQVLGVSRDTVANQKKFQDKYKLPFTLIADESGDVAKAFGVEMIPALGVAKRQSFLIKDGKIAWFAEKAKTAESAQEVQAAIDSLK